MILKIQEDLSEATLDTLVGAYNNLEAEEELIIYFTSGGGLTKVAEVFVDLINRNKDRTTLIGYGDICSSAFHAFYLSECKRELLPGAYGMYHQSSMPVDMNETMRPNYTYGLFQEKYLKVFCSASTMNFCNYLGFDEKQMALMKKGKDIWFMPHEMEAFLRTSQRKNYEKRNS